jgi:SPP1 gp7 family putative phage head morphogenesis protein
MPDIGNRKVDKLERRSNDLGVELYAEQSVIWTKELKKLKSYEDYANLSPLIKPLRLLYDKTFTLSYLEGYDSMDRDIKAIESGRIKLQSEFEFFNTLDDQIATLKAKKVIPPAVFKAATPEIKATSFSVQKIERTGALIDVKNSLINSINTGLDFEEWRENIDQIFEKRGITPLNPYHVENVFRTNIHSVYNLSRRQAGMASPIVEGFEYVIVFDNRTTEEICIPLGGLRYPKDDSIWANIWPPNHYMCRSTTLPITIGYVRREGVEWSDTGEAIGAEVQEDFSKQPATMKGYSAKIGRKEKSNEKEVKKLDVKLEKITKA